MRAVRSGALAKFDRCRQPAIALERYTILFEAALTLRGHDT